MLLDHSIRFFTFKNYKSKNRYMNMHLFIIAIQWLLNQYDQVFIYFEKSTMFIGKKKLKAATLPWHKFIYLRFYSNVHNHFLLFIVYIYELYVIVYQISRFVNIFLCFAHFNQLLRDSNSYIINAKCPFNWRGHLYKKSKCKYKSFLKFGVY